MDADIQNTSDAGVAGDHQQPPGAQLLIAPSTDGKTRNNARIGLISVACWQVDDIRFNFDSSFVLPEARSEMQLLAGIIAAHTTASPAGQAQPPPVSIFGHADPVGQDDYNKYLSGRRAAVIYGMLTRRDEVWEDLYSNTGTFTGPAAGDKWGTAAIQTMLSALGQPVEIDGVNGPETAGALKQFQDSKGLPADGVAGPSTRKQLFLAYMDFLCVDAAGQPFQVDRNTGFLAQGQDSSGKGDFQGCGEFNPRLIFSDQENTAFEQAEDKNLQNEANSPNRRVVALLYRPGSIVDPAKWPCPRAKEGTSGCRLRFWSDGDTRRSTRLPDQDRKYENTHDTFACRFYDRMVSGSPCERILTVWSIRLFDSAAAVMANVPYRLNIQGDIREGQTDSQGWIREKSVTVPSNAVLEWGTDPDAQQPDILMYQMEVELTFQDGTSDEQDGVRFHNLGYGEDCTDEDAVGHFQQDYGLPVTGTVDSATSQKLAAAHDACTPVLKPSPPSEAATPPLQLDQLDD